MSPPIFTDLGKPAKEVFEKGHILEVFKLSAKNKTCGGFAMKTGMVHKFEDGSFKGDVEGTYPYPRYGITVTKKWNTENIIGLAAELANKIYPGLTLKGEGTFAPDTGAKSGSYTITFKHEKVAAQAAISGGTEDNMLLNGSVVLGHSGWLLGGKGEFDNTDGSLKNHEVALGHSYGNIQAFLFSKNLSSFTASIYQRVSDRLEMGLNFGTDTGESKKIYHLGCRYLLDDSTSIRAKVDNDSMIGLGLESQLGGCVKFIFSCLLDGKKLNEGGHKFGMGVDIM